MKLNFNDSLLGILLLALIGLGFFAERQTQSFRFYQILSDLPPNEKRRNSPLPVYFLAQPFTYFDSGEQFYAFIGADGKTILKFLKHYHHLQKRNLTPVLESCQIAYDELREQTGLIA